MTELIDIYDDKYNLIGHKSKKLVHKEGDWHRVFTCIVVNSLKNKIILQKKNPGKYEFERLDYIDISVGGHYKKGEVLEDGVREIEEELGIKVDYNDLEYLGVRQTSAILGETYINNEFQEIHLLDSKLDLSEYKLNDEVGGFISIDIDLGLKLFQGILKEVYVENVYLKEGENIIQHSLITLEDFVPNYLKTDQIFLRLFIAAKRYIENQQNPKTYPLLW